SRGPVQKAGCCFSAWAPALGPQRLWLASIGFVSLIVAPSNVVNLTLAQPHHSLLLLRNDRSFHERPLEGTVLKGRPPQISTAQIRSDKLHTLKERGPHIGAS